MSFKRNGREEVIKALIMPQPDTAAKHTHPSKWQINSPIKLNIILEYRVLALFEREQKNTSGKKPRIKPPVGPASRPTPPRKPEKTGRPTQPSIIYVKIPATDHLALSI